MSLFGLIFGIILWIFWPLLWAGRRTWDASISVAFMLACSWRKKIPLPPVFNPILLLPASQLAFNIRIRKVRYLFISRFLSFYNIFYSYYIFIIPKIVTNIYKFFNQLVASGETYYISFYLNKGLKLACFFYI